MRSIQIRASSGYKKTMNKWGTIRLNLCASTRPNVDRILLFLKDTYRFVTMRDKIITFPDQYETKVGDRGLNFETEGRIQGAFDTLGKGRLTTAGKKLSALQMSGKPESVARCRLTRGFDLCVGESRPCVSI